MANPVHHQLVIYAADPHRLARFWAEAMGYVLEDNTSLIDPLLEAGVAKESDTVVIDGRRFWGEAVDSASGRCGRRAYRHRSRTTPAVRAPGDPKGR